MNSGKEVVCVLVSVVGLGLQAIGCKGAVGLHDPVMIISCEYVIVDLRVHVDNLHGYAFATYASCYARSRLSFSNTGKYIDTNACAVCISHATETNLRL